MEAEDFFQDHDTEALDDNERHKLVSVFRKLTHQEIEAEKLKSMQPLVRFPKECLEINPETDRYVKEYLEFPKRPIWNYTMSKEEVEQHEQEAFDHWMQSMEERYGESNQLSWYERNLEVWRQLWRVLEISDVLLIVMDIRNPLLHFSRSLYHYITQELKRKIIGVFNKVDLVSDFTVFAWKKYFEEEFPEIQIATFSCFPRDPQLIDDTATFALKKQAKRPKKRYYYAQGVKEILSLCRDMVDKPDVTVDWKSIIAQYDKDETNKQQHDKDDSDSSDDDESDDESDTGSMDGLDDTFGHFLEITGEEIKPHKNYITLGLVGHPNVGKSSLINSIMQRTVVSTSKTPGHTKHFQTIHIAKNVRLCDSPGLVFPALIPRSLQILSGMYPIAQVQEPYSSIRYLAERIPLEKILGLTPPINYDEMNDPDYYLLNATSETSAKNPNDYPWSAWSILEAFGDQRGFHIAKTPAPDVYRGNVLLDV
ncbi:P-loop containing nucleoside triphosphate hydrolase protein [Mycotypha africana]|uniref:P-loop containing nucleoside triphosphate hydrolase protein n=1 Tax=Mycotypha africana TaxID=64632 RepID=UPI00230024CE|nr:P-loop containing nucleoside triphosphate hydrolase protein [Mycotypha africana]KAI8973520.1 P-loop containing nucleoside triphosphate hydrolase protein [Mycotypha africana]